MKESTKQTILSTAKSLFATNGYEGFSMRVLAKDSGAGASSIYHFFSDKDVLLGEIFESTRKNLGKKRSKLPNTETASEMLYQRIIFQFENIEDVIFILKYYLHFRQQFLKHDSGYIPSRAYLHIEEVLRRGVTDGDFNIPADKITDEAKTITHAINGFLLEYYPHTPKDKELDVVAANIHQFVMRSITNKEVPM